jgi:hypothetical protein
VVLTSGTTRLTRARATPCLGGVRKKGDKLARHRLKPRIAELRAAAVVVTKDVCVGLQEEADVNVPVQREDVCDHARRQHLLRARSVSVLRHPIQTCFNG